MYLVELRPGKEELYRSGDDLAAAIRSGDVDGHSRIYHRATSKWISITLHPQYKAIVAERPAEPQPAVDRSNWTYLNAQSETLEGAAPDEGAGEIPSRDRLHPWRRSMALSITGLLLVLGIQVSFSGPRPPWSARPAAVGVKPARAPMPASTSHVVSLASTTWGAPAPVEQPAEPAPAPAAPLLPRAPKLRVKSLGEAVTAATETREAESGTVDALLGGYSAAYDSAQGRLEAGMRVTRLEPDVRSGQAHAQRGPHRDPARPGRRRQLHSRVPAAGDRDRAAVPGFVHRDVTGPEVVAQGGAALVFPAPSRSQRPWPR